MAIHGTIEEAGGLADVLQLLALGRKSGCLHVVDGDSNGKVYLELGQVSFATVANRKDRLGDMLVKSGRITRDQLTAATDIQRNSKRQLGRILVDSGSIDRAEVEKFIRLQVEEAVYFLFTWTTGTFTFSSDQLAAHQSLLVSLDPESLLLEGARRVDEWSLIQKRIPSFDLIYRLDRQKLSRSAADDLTAEQKRIIPMLDGTRDVNGLIDLSGMTEFDVGKALYGLVVAGFAQLIERRARVRHLEYRELLAYVVREASYADPQRRKDAARHIVDCPSCAERLRTIHVRRTTDGVVPEGIDLPGVPAPSSPAATANATIAAAPAPVAAAPPPAPPAPRPSPPVVQPAAKAPSFAPAVPLESVRLPERRSPSGRRSGQDRRQFERRAGLDRRSPVPSQQWAASNERRQGPRREDERRSSTVQLRAMDFERRISTTQTGPIARPSSPGDRTTEAWRIEKPRSWDTHEPFRTADDDAAIDKGKGIERRSASSFPRPPVDLDRVIDEQNAASVKPAGAEQPVQPPLPKPLLPPPITGAPSGVEWLVSPEESREMYRASQASLRKSQSSLPQPVAQRTSTTAPVPVATASTTATHPTPLRQLPMRWMALAATITGITLLGFVGRKALTGGKPETEQAIAANVPPLDSAAHSSASGVVTTRKVVPQNQGQNQKSQPQNQRNQPQNQNQVAASQPVVNAPAPRQQEAAPVPQPTAPVQQQQRATPLPAPQPGPVQPPAATQQAITRPNAPQVTSAPTVTQLPAAQPNAAPSQPANVAANNPPPASAPAAAAPAPAPSSSASASEPDRELSSGGWSVLDRADAAALLNGPIAGISGLRIESIAKSTAGTRTRIRVAQITSDGQRIILTETRAGTAAPEGPSHVTAVRVMPPSEAYPLSTGTASLGTLLVTAKSAIAADQMRSLLERLSELR